MMKLCREGCERQRERVLAVSGKRRTWNQAKSGELAFWSKGSSFAAKRTAEEPGRSVRRIQQRRKAQERTNKAFEAMSGRVPRRRTAHGRLSGRSKVNSVSQKRRIASHTN